MNGWLRRFVFRAIGEIVRRQLGAAAAAAGVHATGPASPPRGPRIRGFVRARDPWGRPRLAAQAGDVRDAEIV